MRLMGDIEINGTLYKAIMDIRNGASRTDNRGCGVTLVNNRWKAQRTVDGKVRFFGYYDNRDDAVEAARTQTNLARNKRVARAAVDGTGVTYDVRGKRWRVKLTVNGQRVSLGRYATRGHAVLVRDVVARRTGRTAIVDGYEMPLALVTDPVARSFIRDRIEPVTAADMAEYERRVNLCNVT